MKQKRIYCLLAAALAFAGCSYQDLGEVTPETGDEITGDALYMNVTVQLPVGPGTRSVTGDEGGSSDGTEIGKDYENKVNSVLLVLADKENKFIAYADKSESLTTNNGTVTTTQSIAKSVLSNYYGGDTGELTDDEVHVFVFCNPTSGLKDAVANAASGDAAWYDAVCSISETPDGISDNATIWGGTDNKGGFLMSSSAISAKKFPAKFADWDNFTSADKSFNLSGDNQIDNDTDHNINNGGAIEVERSVARFDFKDGSPTETKANTYNVVRDNGGNAVVQIELQKIALVNMSKNFYYLRRVSSDGLSTGSTLCGLETSSNYVVDTDAADKNGKGINYDTHFNFCLGNTANGWSIDPTARNQWYTSNISDVLGGDDDNPEWSGTGKYGNYKIWRYATENTIPGVDNQKTGITTGIVFKGKMLPSGTDENSSLYKALKNATGDSAADAILYAYGNEIFVRWTEVRAMALERSSGDPMYEAVFGKPSNAPVAEKLATDGSTVEVPVYSDDVTSADYLWNKWFNGGKTEADLTAFKKAAIGNAFTLYQSSSDETYGNGYYCYYFYWNRHNDNSNNGVMAPMEFAVVRNNVYKLAVTNIKKLGHPRVSENDPDPVSPEDPDEEGDVYLSVSVEVLPWVVRVNDIEF